MAEQSEINPLEKFEKEQQAFRKTRVKFHGANLHISKECMSIFIADTGKDFIVLGLIVDGHIYSSATSDNEEYERFLKTLKGDGFSDRYLYNPSVCHGNFEVVGNTIKISGTASLGARMQAVGKIIDQYTFTATCRCAFFKRNKFETSTTFHYIGVIRNQRLLIKRNPFEHTKNLGNKARNSEGKKGCYVATCIYGSYDCPEVLTLRRFRDNNLNHLWVGRVFIRLYYMISPKVIKTFGKNKWFNKLCKPILDKLVVKLQKSGIENSPYVDM